VEALNYRRGMLGTADRGQGWTLLLCGAAAGAQPGCRQISRRRFVGF